MFTSFFVQIFETQKDKLQKERCVYQFSLREDLTKIRQGFQFYDRNTKLD